MPQKPALRCLNAGGSRPPRKKRWLAAVVLLLSWAGGLDGGRSVAFAGPEETEAKEAAPTVVLIVDYADGVQKRFPQVPFREGDTVADALAFAKKHPRGIRYQFRGNEATALLTQIDDLPNEGRGRRNWIYRVNGEMGKTSFAVAPVKAKDVILWKFERYR